MIILKIAMISACVFVGLFLLTFLIYIFNLDMKLAAKMGPIMNKYYDAAKVKRERKK